MIPGKRKRRKKKVPEVTAVSLGVSDTEKEVPAKPGEWGDERRRGLHYNTNSLFFIHFNVVAITFPAIFLCYKVKRRSRRKIIEAPVLSSEDLEAEPGCEFYFCFFYVDVYDFLHIWLIVSHAFYLSVPRRTRRKRNPPAIMASEELNSKTVRPVAGKN